jgi:tetratricopeptide (TPR) repeat protein
MKKIILFFIAIVFSQIIIAQKLYDPLTDPFVQKPNSMFGISADMMGKREAILKETEYIATVTNDYLEDFLKTKQYKSILQLVLIKNNQANIEERAKNYEIAKQLCYQIVWNKEWYNAYAKEDAKTAFYYFKTCYDLGRLLYTTKDYNNAYEFYTTASPFYKPDSSQYFAANAGIEAIKNNTLSAADNGFVILRMINQAVVTKPNSAGYLATRGKYYWDIVKDTAKAFADFTKAVQLNPKDEIAYEYLSIINYYKSNLKEAINCISKSIAINKYEASYFAKRAFFNMELQGYAAAITDFDEAVFWDQTNASYYIQRAECNVKLNNYTAAYDDYGFATMLNPNDDNSKKELQKLDPLLKSEYEKMGFTPQNAFQFFLKRADGFVFTKNGTAVMNYYKCIQVEPKNPVPYNKAGKIFKSLKMNSFAEQFLRYAAYADGKDPEYFFDLGNYYYENKSDFKAASGCFDTAAILGSVNAIGFFTNGFIKHDQLKNYNGALKDYNNALALNPSLKEVLKLRGALYMEQFKNYKAAMADFETYSKLDPNDEDNKVFIATCKERMKE